MTYDEYNEVFELCKKFHTLGKLEVKIMDYLWKNEEHHMTYTELSRAIGEKDTNITNVRKAVIKLYKHGIINADCYVLDDNWEDTEKCKPITICYIVDGWIQQFLR